MNQRVSCVALLTIILLSASLSSCIPATLAADDVLGAPNDFTVQAMDGAALLSWSAPSNASEYTIDEYWIFRGSPAPLTLWVTLGNVTSFMDIGLANGAEYHYGICAVTDQGQGEMTDIVSVIPCTVPSAPLLPVAFPGNMFLNLTWSTPNFDGGSTILGYNIYSSDDTEKIGSTAASYYIHSLLDMGTEYEYQVAAFNAAGEGPMSELFSGTPDIVPGAPIGLFITGGVRNVTLEWDPPEENGGSELIGYKIYRGNISDQMELLNVVIGVETLTDYGLLENTTYYYSISAFNSVGEGERSTSVAAMVMENASLRISTVVEADSQIGLYWQVEGENAASALRYWIYRGSDESNLSLLTEPTVQLSYWDGELINGERYYYQVGAENPTGMGWSQIVSAVPRRAPSAPENLTLQSFSEFIELTWTPPADDGGSEILSYKIFMGCDGSQPSYLGEAAGLQYVSGGLTNGHRYSFVVSACNAAGEGDRCEAVDIICGLAPSQPRNITVQSGEGFVHVSWLPPEQNGTYPLLGYILEREMSGSTVRFDIDTIEYNDTSVVNGNTYEYSVKAYNEIDEGTSSQSCIARPFWDGRAPFTVVNLTAESKIDRIFLAWETPYDGGQPITSYVIYRGASSDMLALRATVTGTWYNDTDLPPESTYYYKVVASNVIGSGPDSPVVNATTDSVINTTTKDPFEEFVFGPLPYILVIMIGAVAIIFLFRNRILRRFSRKQKRRKGSKKGAGKGKQVLKGEAKTANTKARQPVNGRKK